MTAFPFEVLHDAARQTILLAEAWTAEAGWYSDDERERLVAAIRLRFGDWPGVADRIFAAANDMVATISAVAFERPLPQKLTARTYFDAVCDEYLSCRT